MDAGPGRSLAAPVGLAVAAVLLTVLLSELAFRWIGRDFSGAAAALEAQPVYYRHPRVPVGSVFFRRAGPAVWEGPVRAVGFQRAFPEAAPEQNPYRGEPAIRVHYDEDGFRNPDDLDDWEIAVVGDSYTPLGYLPEEDLFSSQLSRLRGVPVRNLGTSYTGTLSHVAYLEHFGGAPGLRHSVLVFAEGNDLWDLRRERAALRKLAKTGRRPLRELRPQTSLLRHLVGRLRGARAGGQGAVSLRSLRSRTAWFRTGSGEEVEVTVSYRPPSPRQLGPEERNALAEAFGDFASTARRLGSRPWVLYMPCKRRVLHARLRFGPRADPRLAAWTPTDLPELVRALAQERGMGFIDPTPALLAETERGRLTYNGVWETHLNRQGSHIVGRVLAQGLPKPRG